MKATRLVSSTRLSERDFWQSSLLGRSLRLFPDALRPELHIRFDNHGEWGLPEIYNRAIEDCPVEKNLLFVHDDVFLHDPFLQHRLDEALCLWDVVGLAGSRGSDLSQPSWGLGFDEQGKPVGWQAPKAGFALSGAVSHVSRYREPGEHRYTAPAPILGVYGALPAECDLLDGLFLAVNAALIKEWNVRFEERLRFHLYDLDFCRAAKKKNLHLSTWPILCSHGSGGNFDSEEFRAASRIYLEKWASIDASNVTPPPLVECPRCSALLLAANVTQHASWHAEQTSHALEELRSSDALPEAS